MIDRRIAKLRISPQTPELLKALTHCFNTRAVGHTSAASEGFKNRGVYYVHSYEYAKELQQRGVRAKVWGGTDCIRGTKEPIAIDHALLQQWASECLRAFDKLRALLAKTEKELREMKEKRTKP